MTDLENSAFVTDASDESQVEDAKDKERLQRLTELDDVHKVMSTESGRRFVARILEHCRVGHTIWAEGEKIYRNAGSRDVGHWLWAEVSEADIELYFKMIREDRNRRMQ